MRQKGFHGTRGSGFLLENGKDYLSGPELDLLLVKAGEL